MPLIFVNMGRQGIDGMMYTAPISDCLAAIASILMIRSVFKKFDRMANEENSLIG